MPTTEARDREEVPPAKAGAGVSKLKLAVGAAGLLLFIVGLKRSFRPEAALPAEEGEDGQGGGGAGASQ